MTREEIQEYFDRYTDLRNRATTWESHWKEVNEYILPDQGFFYGQHNPNEGEKRHSKIINDTAEMAVSTFAAGMQGGMTSPSRPWFRLTVPDADLAEFQPVRQWLEYVERLIYRVLAKSNFYGCVLGMYQDVGAYGTGCVYSEEKDDSVCWFRNCAVGEYYVSDGPWGTVDTLYRKITMSLRNLASLFGKSNLSESRRLQVDQSPFEPITVLHAVHPRTGADPNKRDAKSMPFASVWLEDGVTDEALLESGYMEFPFFVPRWSTTGSDAYGRSPGMRILGHVKMLQEIEKNSIMAQHKQVDPPLRLPSSMKGMGKTSTIPGAISYIDSSDVGQAGPLYQVNVDFGALEGKIIRIENAIREGLYNNLFMAILNSGGQMTAREVAERHEEKLLMLGPFIDRHQQEFHNPVIDRTFAILMRAGMTPKPPQELMGQDLKVEYISILAQAQKMVGTTSIQSTANFVGALAAMKPEVLDKFDADEAVDQFAEMIGAPVRIVVADDKVSEIRQARRQQMMEQQQQAQAMAGIGAAQQLSQVNTQPGNVVGDIKEALMGEQE